MKNSGAKELKNVRRKSLITAVIVENVCVADVTAVIVDVVPVIVPKILYHK